LSAASQFSDSSTTGKNLLFHYISSAATAREEATVTATKGKRSSAFKTWQEFLRSIEFTGSLYLDGLTSFQKNIVMSAFAQAVRSSALSTRYNRHLVEGTVQATISYVAQAFGANDRPDPRLDSDGKICFLLKEQFRAYKNQDGSKKKQKALPMMVLRKILDLSETEWQKATAWLLIGAIFFAMRSCEYLHTKTSESERRTKILRLRNIIFKKDGISISHKSKDLEKADIVMIIFEFQKNDKRDVQVHMFQTSDDVLNPVKAWAMTVKRVWGYKNSSEDTTVCTFQNTNGTTTQIFAPHVRDWLKRVVELLGEQVLGFTKDDIGLHSIRSGGAMAMFLSRTPTIIMMRVGRWSSDAFLEYIREQIENFTLGVSENMIKYETFFTMNREQANDNQHSTSTNNEDGPSDVPFRIDFSNISLNGSETLTKSRN
jgi:hypothetical protein